MKNIVFKEQEGVFVADFASEGNCVIQIDKIGRASCRERV